ncbi:TPA_asm: hypothetical protein [Capsaspora MELD virus 2]|nr:TPA_asm: hypothetical protein [Capsaspora MELD virus 2]
MADEHEERIRCMSEKKNTENAYTDPHILKKPTKKAGAFRYYLIVQCASCGKNKSKSISSHLAQQYQVPIRSAMKSSFDSKTERVKFTEGTKTKADHEVASYSAKPKRDRHKHFQTPEEFEAAQEDDEDAVSMPSGKKWKKQQDKLRADKELKKPIRELTPEEAAEIFVRVNDADEFIEEHPEGLIVVDPAKTTAEDIEKLKDMVDGEQEIDELEEFGDTTPRVIELQAADRRYDLRTPKAKTVPKQRTNGARSKSGGSKIPRRK